MDPSSGLNMTRNRLRGKPLGHCRRLQSIIERIPCDEGPIDGVGWRN